LSGLAPELAGYKTADDELEGLIAWLQERVKEDIPLDRIAVFARTDALLGERVRPALSRAGYAAHGLDDVASEGEVVNIGTMHRAKGLEFRAVAVVGCEAANLPSPHGLARIADPADRAAYLERERNLLYVACTRAREHLRVSWVGEPAKGIV
jgi:superfamily I DNA/RNA helicase